MRTLTLMSWNVNGIRAAVRNGFEEFLKTAKPDILGLQEIKIDHAARAQTNFDFRNYEEYWNPAERPGYSGTATLIRQKTDLAVKKIADGFGIEKFDSEGRAQTFDCGLFYFVNLYFPNSNHELSRLGYKLEFDTALLRYAKKLEQKKPVVLCGDFNVAHNEIDLKNPKTNVDNAGFTPQEREWMNEFIRAGFIDTFRHLHPDAIKYSWWSYRFKARERDAGWRIDYFFISRKLSPKLKKAFILDDVQGSDHCPVGIEIAI